jgi:predicted Zn-dependent peptidase
MYGSHQGQSSTDSIAGGDYQTIRLADHVYLHAHHAPHFMASRVDIFIHDRLRPLQNTKLALLSRILERGTNSLPTMRAISQFVDGLFGAAYVSEIDQFGDVQAIHLGLEVLDSTFLPDRTEDLLGPGLDLLRDVLFDPYLENEEEFPQRTVEREKRALDRQIGSLLNDKSAYAQRRCVQEMCGEEPYGLFALGDLRDLPSIDGRGLWQCHEHLLTSRPMDIFFSSRHQIDADTVAQFERRFASSPKRLNVDSGLGFDAEPNRPSRLREIVDTDEVSQGRLVFGLRTSTGLADAAFPALVVLNNVLGSDGHSRLHRTVREEAGLCYYIGSFLEPLCRLMFIEAGIDTGDYEEARSRIEDEQRAIGSSGPSGDELARAKKQLMQRLYSLTDDREALMRFYFARRIGKAEIRRAALARQIEAVTVDDVREVARGLYPDTVYFLSGRKGVDGR